MTLTDVDKKLIRQITGVALARCLSTAFWTFLSLAVLQVGLDWAGWPAKDTTDPMHGRSGLKLRTDCLTGVQYLEGRYGLTVRLDEKGDPIIDRSFCQ